MIYETVLCKSALSFLLKTNVNSVYAAVQLVGNCRTAFLDVFFFITLFFSFVGKHRIFTKASTRVHQHTHFE